MDMGRGTLDLHEASALCASSNARLFPKQKSATEQQRIATLFASFYVPKRRQPDAVCALSMPFVCQIQTDFARCRRRSEARESLQDSSVSLCNLFRMKGGSGGRGRDRTYDQSIKSRMLYQLSYASLGFAPGKEIDESLCVELRRARLRSIDLLKITQLGA